MAKKLMGKAGAKSGADRQEQDKQPKEKLLCDRCGVEMEMIEVSFQYLSRGFRHKVPRCPECGQVSLPEDLVTGKMADVESMIEDK